ncbi:hypothetical protein [Amycolatopsis jejuensis]|uniref:hypothetical protein n=1 Tax=Amycolatopsis jejuensis TaxID=330084 RepID=UPI0012E050EB|nr:hypothetical protein [Amycolatopsis jejuensis]
MSTFTGEVEAVGALMEEALDTGAFGLSTGLAYPPGIFSGSGELAASARRLPADRPYIRHVCSEGALLMDALADALAAGAVHASHLKVAGRQQRGSMPQVLEMLDRASADGNRGTPRRPSRHRVVDHAGRDPG